MSKTVYTILMILSIGCTEFYQGYRAGKYAADRWYAGHSVVGDRIILTSTGFTCYSTSTTPETNGTTGCTTIIVQCPNGEREDGRVVAGVLKCVKVTK